MSPGTAAPAVPPRTSLIADAGIAILAGRGRPGLTHRAVDAEAGLPPGSTSYYARTRDALCELVLRRLAELDLHPGDQPGDQPVDRPGDVDGLAAQLAGYLYAQLTTHRERTLARYELSLEAVHRPALRAILAVAGEPFRAAAAALLATLGSPDPDRHGRMLVACCDGLVFDALAGATAAEPPGPERLRNDLHDLLTGMLAQV